MDIGAKMINGIHEYSLHVNNATKYANPDSNMVINITQLMGLSKLFISPKLRFDLDLNLFSGSFSNNASRI